MRYSLLSSQGLLVDNGPPMDEQSPRKLPHELARFGRDFGGCVCSGPYLGCLMYLPILPMHAHARGCRTSLLLKDGHLQHHRCANPRELNLNPGTRHATSAAPRWPGLGVSMQVGHQIPSFALT